MNNTVRNKLCGGIEEKRKFQPKMWVSQRSGNKDRPCLVLNKYVAIHIPIYYLFIYSKEHSPS